MANLRVMLDGDTHRNKKTRQLAAIVHVMTDSVTPTRLFDNISKLVMVTLGQRSHRDLQHTKSEKCTKLTLFDAQDPRSWQSPQRDCRVILAYMCVKLQMRLYVCQAPCPFCIHFRSILGPFWVHFGSILGPFWVHFGSILGPFWVHFGSILGPFLGPFWVHFGSILGPFKVHFGSIFGSILGPFLGPFWVHFGSFCLLSEW